MFVFHVFIQDHNIDNLDTSTIKLFERKCFDLFLTKSVTL